MKHTLHDLLLDAELTWDVFFLMHGLKQ